MIQPHDAVFPWVASKVALLAELERVVDIGTSARFAKEMAFFEDRFTDNYTALGYQPEDLGAKTCDYDSDILELPFETASLDGVICLEVIEHVTDPPKAASELHRVLRPGGMLLLSTPFLTSYHGKGTREAGRYDPSHTGYPDFWRFAHEGLLLLLKDFASVEVVPVGGPLDTRLQMLKLSRFGWSHSRWFQRLLGRLDRPALGKAAIRHFCFAVR